MKTPPRIAARDLLSGGRTIALRLRAAIRTGYVNPTNYCLVFDRVGRVVVIFVFLLFVNLILVVLFFGRIK